MGTGILNPVHLAFLLVILLLVFGAKRLPELGKSLGTGLRGFKESLDGDGVRAQIASLTDVDASTGRDGGTQHAAPPPVAAPPAPAASVVDEPPPPPATV